MCVSVLRAMSSDGRHPHASIRPRFPSTPPLPSFRNSIHRHNIFYNNKLFIGVQFFEGGAVNGLKGGEGSLFNSARLFS